MGFSDDLWDGFDIVKKKTKDGAIYCEEIAKYLQKFAGLSNSFGKGLQALAKTKITNETDTSLADSWQAIITATENIAKIYIDFSDQMSKTPETMLSYVKEGKKKRKNLSASGKKMIQELSKAEGVMSKAKVNFYKLRKKQDEAMEEYNKAKATQTASVVTKLGKKADQDTKAAEKADKEYADTVTKYKGVQEKVYRDEMPKLLQEYQIFEEERIKSMKGHFEAVLSLHAPIPGNLSQINDSMSSAIQAVDADRDIQTFISKNKSGKSGPDYATYEPYDSSSPTISVSDRGSMIPTSPTSSSPVIRETPSLSLNTSAKIGDLNSSTSLKSSASSPSNSVTTKEKVRALYDYNATDENELSFKANDPITVLQKDDSGWWQGELASGAVGMFPSNFVTSVGSGPVNDEKKVCQCLYDYEATDEDELSMKTGDRMTIDSEDNGWLFVYNQHGKYGRVPSNYVQFI